MRNHVEIYLVLLFVIVTVRAANADHTRAYTTGRLLDLTVQPVDRGTAIIGNMAAPIRGLSYTFRIQVGDLVYFAQYAAGALSDRPNWIVNDPIDLRFEKDKMFLKRPDGKEVEVWLAKTVRVSQNEQSASATSGAGQVSNSSDPKPLELRQALEEVRERLPKWKDALSASDVESLPVQYKTGKQVEVLKSVALDEIIRVEKTSRLLEEGRLRVGFVSAQESVQLLLDMQDAGAATLQLASVIMMSSSQDKSVSPSLDLAKSVLDMSTDIMSEEKRAEVPVMELVTARDALLEVCKAKLTQ
jgi:hypothetical protein